MKIKYPRTYHIPQSPGITSNDKVVNSLDKWYGAEVVILEKMDGENTTIGKDYFHARSLDSKYHESRTWIAKLQSEIGYKLPDNYRICGENLYALHSIPYSNLESYFYVFNIWNGYECLDIDTTLDICKDLNLTFVPVLFKGALTENILSDIISKMDFNNQEGFVIRKTNSFYYKDFSNNIAKYVRSGHIQTDKHWIHRKVIKNKLKGKIESYGEGDENPK